MAKFTRDDVDKFFDYDIDLSSNTIFMGSCDGDAVEDVESGTDYLMAERMLKAMHILERKNDKPITIIMNNGGGDEYHGLAIFDSIITCGKEVTIEVFGHAMSMGSIILQAADHRMMSPNSRMMLHYGTWGHNDHTLNVEAWTEESKKFNVWMEDLYLSKINQKHPNFTREDLKTKMSFDWFLTAKEAVDWGLADGIIGEEEDA